ncbi:MAG: hypothetical protein C0490_14660 [Marivirga sp.]|nr:hypothetical protein [Marivirga sp.]
MELSTPVFKFQKSLSTAGRSSRLKRYLTPTVVGIIGSAANEPDMVDRGLTEEQQRKRRRA